MWGWLQRIARRQARRRIQAFRARMVWTSPTVRVPTPRWRSRVGGPSALRVVSPRRAPRRDRDRGPEVDMT